MSTHCFVTFGEARIVREISWIVLALEQSDPTCELKQEKPFDELDATEVEYLFHPEEGVIGEMLYESGYPVYRIVKKMTLENGIETDIKYYNFKSPESWHFGPFDYCH